MGWWSRAVGVIFGHGDEQDGQTAAAEPSDSQKRGDVADVADDHMPAVVHLQQDDANDLFMSTLDPGAAMYVGPLQEDQDMSLNGHDRDGEDQGMEANAMDIDEEGQPGRTNDIGHEENEAHEMGAASSAAEGATQWDRAETDDEMDVRADDPRVAAQAPFDLKMDSASAVLPSVQRVECRCSWPLSLERRLQLQEDLHAFRSPDLSKLPSAPPVDWSAIASHFVNLLKVGEPWKETIHRIKAIIRHPQTKERLTDDQLFMWLLSQSDESLHRHLLAFRMERNPVPFIVNGAVMHNLGASMPEIPLLASVKFGEKVLGSSNILNKTFQTKFEENNQKSGHTRGYAQIQFASDYMKNGRWFAVADVHGAVDSKVLSVLARYAQALLVHVDSARLEEQNMVAAVLQLCRALAGAKPVVVLLRDDPMANNQCEPCRPSSLSGLPPGVLVLALPNLSSATNDEEEEAADNLRKILIEPQHLGLALGGGNASGSFPAASCSWLPEKPFKLKQKLQHRDLENFRLLELAKLPTAKGEAIAGHLMSLLKDSEPWEQTMKHLDPVICNPETAERATEEQLFIWLLTQCEDSFQKQLLSLRMARSPVPFIINGAVFHNVYPCMPKMPFLLSVKFDEKPLGATALLDKMFGTNVALHAQDSSGGSTGVQVQLASIDKENRRRFAVADAHGKMDGQLLSALAPRVQAVLLHVDSASLSNESMVSELVQISSALSSVSKRVIVLLRDDPLIRKWKICDPSLMPIFPSADLVVALPNFAHARQQLGEDASILRMVLMQPQYLGSALGGDHEASGRFSRSNLQALLGDHGMETPEAVEEVIRAIDAEPVGKLEEAHIDRCVESKKISMSNVQEDRQTMLRCYEAEKGKKLYLQQLCLDGQHQSIRGFIRCLRHDDAAAQLQELQKRSAPVKTLFKELYLLMEEKELRGGLSEEGPAALADYIWAGNPFEILDGDNLHLHNASLSKAFAILDKRLRKEGLKLYVESAIGPQSAGKSTLNNSKYGCRFKVSEGRCTRGIYGQLVRMKDAALLILDTEGLDSVQKQDGSRHSDRVMTLLILATSHHIDFIIKGNLTENMKSLIQVCIRAAQELETEAKIASPNLHWIFNQVADPETKFHVETLEITDKELLEAFAYDGKSTQEKIRLDKDNYEIVPSMFNGHEATLGEEQQWTKFDISIDYAKKVRNMRRKAESQRAIRMLQPAPEGEQKPLLLADWLSLLALVFRTIQSFPDLTHFQDVKHVRLDHELRSSISCMLKQSFQTPEALQEEQAKLEEWKESACLLDAELRLNHHFEELSHNLKEKLKKRCAELGCDAQIADRMKRILESKLATRCSSWQTQLARHYQDADVKRACVDGHSEICKLIREILKQPAEGEGGREQLTDQDLKRMFEDRWQRIIDGMEGKFNFDEFAYKLLRSMLEVSGHPYRPSPKVLKGRLECQGSVQESRAWITRDGHRPLQKWKTPTEGASWKRFFRDGFLAAMDPPVGDEHMREAEDELMMPQDADAHDVFQVMPQTASRTRTRGKRPEGPSTMAEARKRQRLSPLVEHLRDPSISRLGSKQLIEEIEREKVINFELAFQVLDEQVSNLVDPTCRPDINLVQLVDQVATNVIDDVNKALKAIGCTLTSDGKGEFVMRALIKAWNLVKQNHYETYMQPIEEFKMEKTRQQEFFIASIKQDMQSDTIIARKLALEVAEVIYTAVSNKGELLLKEVIENNRRKLSREALQEQVDACFGTKNIYAQERAILHPAEVLKARFDSAFEDVRIEAGRQVSGCCVKVELQLKGLSAYADHLCRLPGMEQANTMSEQVFELCSSHSGGPSVTREAKRWAACQWLLSAFVKDADELRQWPTPDLWEAGCLVVSVREGKLPVHLFSGAVDDDSLNDARDAVSRVLKEHPEGVDGGLGCIHEALAKMAAAFVEAQTQIQEKLKTRLDKQLDSMRSDLRAAVVPCPATCPCCGRMCDNPEPAGKDVAHVHRCSSGHQCRGFKGVFLNDGKRTASTRICSQVKDDDDYIDENGVQWKWIDFKQSLPEWDFSDRYDERAQELQARSLSAWKMVGQRICNKFSIRFTPLGEEQTLGNSRRPVHDVLVLDSSSSMTPDGWKALHEAVTSLLQVRSQKEGREEDRVSAVAFSAPNGPSNSGLVELMLYKDLDEAQAIWAEKSAPPLEGRTDFVLAIKGAVSILKACKQHKHHRIQLIFISDGADNEGSGLKDAINELQAAVGDRPFSAVTLGFGTHCMFGRLHEVAKLLGGEYVEGLTEVDLKEKFVEVAQRVTP